MITDEDLRDTAACHALTGLLSADANMRMTYDDAVRMAYDVAQKMVAERGNRLRLDSELKRVIVEREKQQAEDDQKKGGENWPGENNPYLSDEYRKALRLSERILKRREGVQG